MHITGMKIGGIPPFTEPVEFEFDERVNVFIGLNAAGKSTLLQYLLTEYQEGRWDVYGDGLPMSKVTHSVIDGREVYSSQSSTLTFEWQRSEISFDAQAGTVSPKDVSLWDVIDVLDSIGAPIVAIPATRVRYDNSSRAFPSKRFFESLGAQISGVGMMSEPLYSNDVHNIVNDIYNLIENVSDDINYTDHVDFAFPAPPKDMAANFQNAIDLAFRCARDISKEVIQGASPGNDTNVTHTKTASRTTIGFRPCRYRSAYSGTFSKRAGATANNLAERWYGRNAMVDPTSRSYPATRGQLPIRMGKEAGHTAHRRNREPPASHLAAPRHPRVAGSFPRLADFCHHALALRGGRVEGRAGASDEPG